MREEELSGFVALSFRGFTATTIKNHSTRASSLLRVPPPTAAARSWAGHRSRAPVVHRRAPRRRRGTEGAALSPAARET